MVPHALAPGSVPDVELPFRTRHDDAPGTRPVRSGDAAGGTWGSDAPAPASRLPFLANRLLGAAGPFGLDVELKSGDRVVGTWAIDVKAPGLAERQAAQALASLYLCASTSGDARANGAFLVLRQWEVEAADKHQVETLYESLSVATLERLDSLLGGVPEVDGESRVCVLFLIDGRRADRLNFSLDRLQIRLLEDLESEHTVIGVDLRVAHGRGTGTRPHVVFASTLPPTLPGEPEPESTGDAGTRARPVGALIGEVFVRETLSPENIRWNRRASDRAR